MTIIHYQIVQTRCGSAAELTADDLDYRCFLGDVSVHFGEVVLDASWAWVPIAHFATMLLIAINDLLNGGDHAEIEFTESEAVIYLDRTGSAVRVSASFAPVRETVEIDELGRAVIRFASSFFDEILQGNPSLIVSSTLVQRLHLIKMVQERLSLKAR